MRLGASLAPASLVLKALVSELFNDEPPILSGRFFIAFFLVNCYLSHQCRRGQYPTILLDKH